MARSEGFEPSTAWFVARYSIQLSYERTDNFRQFFNYIYINNGALGRIRTFDRLVRSQVLYPAELRARNNDKHRDANHTLFYTKTKNGGEGGIRTLDTATNRILP